MSSWTVTWGIIQASAIIILGAWLVNWIRWSWILEELNLFKVIVGMIIGGGLFIVVSLKLGELNK